MDNSYSLILGNHPFHQCTVALSILMLNQMVRVSLNIITYHSILVLNIRETTILHSLNWLILLIILHVCFSGFVLFEGAVICILGRICHGLKRLRF